MKCMMQGSSLFRIVSRMIALKASSYKTGNSDQESNDHSLKDIIILGKENR